MALEDPAFPQPDAGESARRDAFRRRGRRLEWITLAACAAEAVVGLAAGGVAASVALLGFGLQSLVEVISGGIMLWRLAPIDSLAPRAGRKDERLALRLIGLTLFLVAACIAYGAGRALLLRERPEASPIGIALAVASLVSMPLLARAKRRVAAQLHSAALKADAVHTDVCTWQAAIMLVGLGLNMALGWWWADPAAAFCMVPLVARAGFLAFRGEACGCITCDTE